MTNSKLYLDVPYAQKDQAKALGARWDASRKKWYIPGGVDSTPFAKWQPEALGRDDDLPGPRRIGAGSSPYAKSPSKSSKTGASTQGRMTVAYTQCLCRKIREPSGGSRY